MVAYVWLRDLKVLYLYLKISYSFKLHYKAFNLTVKF